MFGGAAKFGGQPVGIIQDLAEQRPYRCQSLCYRGGAGPNGQNVTNKLPDWGGVANEFVTYRVPL